MAIARTSGQAMIAQGATRLGTQITRATTLLWHTGETRPIGACAAEATMLLPCNHTESDGQAQAINGLYPHGS